MSFSRDIAYIFFECQHLESWMVNLGMVLLFDLMVLWWVHVEWIGQQYLPPKKLRLGWYLQPLNESRARDLYKIQILFDALVVVQAINKSFDQPFEPILHDIKSFAFNFTSVKFSCISRKLNSIIVHDLAKNSYVLCGFGGRGVGSYCLCFGFWCLCCWSFSL